MRHDAAESPHRQGPSVLLATHSPTLTTGYSRVARELAAALVAAGCSVRCVAQGHRAGDDARASPHELISAGHEPVERTIARALDGRPADVLLTVGDPWMFEAVPDLPQRRGLRWVAYFPIDGTPIPGPWKRWIAAADVPAVFCRWTAGVVEREAGVRPVLAYHGVDLRTFAPAADKADAKRRLIGDDRAFIVGCVAANQQRKNLPALVRAFAGFARDKVDAILYLHAPVEGFYDVQELAARFGVEEKTRATLGLTPTRGVDDATLAVVYNAFDVLALPTMAEGFGLPILEAQACGVPVLATDCSACSEFLPDPFQRLAVRDRLIMGRNIEQALADESDLAVKLDRLYCEPALRRDLADRGRRLAAGFAWDAVLRPLVAAVLRADLPLGTPGGPAR